MSENTSPGHLYGYLPPDELSLDDLELHARIDALMQQILSSGDLLIFNINLKKHDLGEGLLNASPEAQISIVLAALGRLAHTSREARSPAGISGPGSIGDFRLIYNVIIRDLLANGLPLSEKNLLAMLRLMIDALPNATAHYSITVAAVLNTVAAFTGRQALSGSVRALLGEFLEAMSPDWEYVINGRQFRRQIDAMMSAGAIAMPGEAWTDAIIADLADVQPDLRERWQGLLEHARSASSASPSSRWLARANGHLAALGTDVFTAALLRWFPGVKKGGTSVMSELNSGLLRGLIWYCRLLDDNRIPVLVCDVGVAALKKISGAGPRAQKVGNACIGTLGLLPGIEPIAQLSRMRLQVRNGTAIRAIEKALDAAAERTGLTREDMEEISVPFYGLGSDGRREEMLGSCAATIDVASGRALLSWRGSNGKSVKSVPAEVRREHPEALAGLKRTVKDIDSMLDAQRLRIERMFLSERSWPYEVWRERYLEHPLLGVHARRLIWRFISERGEQSGIWHDGRIADYRGQALDFSEEPATVRLWSPIGAEVEEVLQWRIWLELKEIVQPFKQAHREVYILTDAERTTRTYSNRFAGHILRQHQFSALCRERGWKYALQGAFDNAPVIPILELPEWGMSVEFWVDAIIDQEHLTESWMALYIATDQVRFYNTGDVPEGFAGMPWQEQRRLVQEWGSVLGPPLPLEQVPPVVLSEVMRDVDLFVGVCSVGTDPAWSDGGERVGNYWQAYSFGDLSATAQTRRDLLGRLIPRLKIAARCTLQDRFLVVRGDRRTYKIHLGSGNILMEPNDQYLCIVPARGGSEGTAFLPFEGDRMLSVIISKAFLLADDTKISDPTILSQLRM